MTPTPKQTKTPASNPIKPAEISRLDKLATSLAASGETSAVSDALHIPDVVGFYMLVALPENTGKRGSVFMPDDVAEAERAATVVGAIIAQGDDCYKGVYPNGAPRYPSGPWCKPGDHVVFSRYTGHRIRVGGVEMRILADDQILAVLTDKARTEVTGL